jgi:hypothetical protein
MFLKDQAVLHIEQQENNVIAFHLESPVHEEGWNDLTLAIAENLFAGRSICFVTFDPPVWDLEVAEVTDWIVEKTIGKENFLLAFAPSATKESLQTAVASTDFKLGSLLIAKIQVQDAFQIEQFLTALCARDPMRHIQTDEEYLECVDDKWLFWLNPTFESIALCIEQARLVAVQNNWRLHFNMQQGNELNYE